MKTEENKRRVVQIEVDDQVKKLTIEGVDKDAQVVMREELTEDMLDSVTGGAVPNEDFLTPNLGKGLVLEVPSTDTDDYKPAPSWRGY
jgi:hypothetical protein